MAFYEISAKDNMGVRDLIQGAMTQTYENLVKSFEISPLDATR